MTALSIALPGLEPRRHLSAAARGFGYAVLGILHGTVAALVVGIGLLLSGALSIVWIGLPLLGHVCGVAWRMADQERRHANGLLGASIEPLPVPPTSAGWRRLLDETSRRPFWRALAMVLLRVPVAAAALVVAGAPLALAVVLLVLGAEGVGGSSELLVGPWSLGAPLGVALWMLALPSAVVGVAAFEATARLQRGIARSLLRTPSTAAGPVRELLAERLGDRSLNIAYWLPDRERFVDEQGRTVELPEPGSGRAWTAVEHDGRRVAAIVHDAGIDAQPQLVQAAASAAALAIDNERLKADLRARVEELRRSRLRIVEAADDARREIERNLHDGAQQRLVALALDLRVLRARLKGNEDAQDTIDELSEKLSAALAELRELARGIHPAILSDRGLAAALEAIVARAPFPVTLDVRLRERHAAPVEACAYFVVAEGLTNVAKYAQAERASVTLDHDGRALVVEVADDGIGGADAARGTGLRGLSDRLAVFEGTISLVSPVGEGTRLRARIPSLPGER